MLCAVNIHDGAVMTVSAVQHRDEGSLVGLQFQTVCIGRERLQALEIKIFGLTSNARYSLEVQLNEKMHTVAGGETRKKVRREFDVFQILYFSPAADRISICLQLPGAISGNFELSAHIIDLYPGLSVDASFVGRKTKIISLDSIFECAAAQQSILHIPPAAELLVSGQISMRQHDDNPPAIFHRISAHDPHRTALTVVLVSFQLIAESPYALSEYSGRHNFSFPHPHAQTQVDLDGMMILIRLPQRLWEAASFLVSLSLEVQEDRKNYTFYRSQIVHTRETGQKLFHHSNSEWCHTSVGLWGREAPRLNFPVASTTLVTGFWSPDEMRWNKRAEESYWPWIDNLLSVETPLIIFTTKDLHKRFLTSGNWSAGPRCIRLLELSRFGVGQLRDELQRMMVMDPEAARYTVEYSMIMHEKPRLLAAAADKNPFATENFLWVDAGIDRTGFLRANSWPKSLPPALHDKIIVLDAVSTVSKFLQPNALSMTSDEAIINSTILLAVHPNVGLTGGIFGGSSRAVSALNLSYYPVLATFLERGAQCLSEQVILTAMSISARTHGNFHLVQEPVPRNVRNYFYLLKYLSQDFAHGEANSGPQSYVDRVVPSQSASSDSVPNMMFSGARRKGDGSKKNEACCNTTNWWPAKMLGGMGQMETLCQSLKIDPEPLGKGHEVTVFRACSADGKMVALHVPFQRSNTLAGFEVLAQHQERGNFNPHVLLVLGICKVCAVVFYLLCTATCIYIPLKVLALSHMAGYECVLPKSPVRGRASNVKRPTFALAHSPI